MADDYKDIEDRIQEALDAMEHEDNFKIHAAAKAFNVPYLHLYAYYKGWASWLNCIPTNMRLSDAQELVLCQWIDTLDKLEIPLRPVAVLGAAHLILWEANPEVKKLGLHWLKHFFVCHPDYYCMRHQAIEAVWWEAMDPESIEEWFGWLCVVIERHGIQNVDIWNVDETGFQIGIGRD